MGGMALALFWRIVLMDGRNPIQKGWKGLCWLFYSGVGAPIIWPGTG